ncbi:T9SS type A sorting domain-containing protein [Hymenobacter rubidus]|uniref:T9SS type A sorting domain-containing protein n=1 Tax=Hymenobacter rubidus TaxID=1441626 RepID=UPI00191CA677|nr:T9SS type A sorting domain-containing protein [Hymenobacter rubidus]
MRISTPFLHGLIVFILLVWSPLVQASSLVSSPPAPAGRPLAEVLNPDGTLKAGLAGSFNASGYTVGTGPNGQPTFQPTAPRKVKGAGDQYWQDGFDVPGADSAVYAIVRAANGDVYIGGGFSAVGSVPARHIAKWNGTAWSALGVGVPGIVKAVAVDANGNVYAGGWGGFGGGSSAYLAKWNGTAWSALGTGVDGFVLALAVDQNGNLYAGGNFTQAGGVAANYIAKWNGTTWIALGTGLNSRVNALTVDAVGNVYAGGSFSGAGGVITGGIAKWNGTTWNALGASFTGIVNALAVNGSTVYVGGNFTLAGVVSYIAQWNGTAWGALGAGVNSSVDALAVDGGGSLYAGGNFYTAGGVAARGVAKWNGTAWSTLGTGTANVFALAVDGNNVYVGGYMTQAGSVGVDCLAKWDGTVWSGFANGINGFVLALAVDSRGNTYIGGYVLAAGGIPINYIAKWNGTAWTALGSGTNDVVAALAVDQNGNIYAGGSFTQAGGVAASHIAKWNGTAWSALGAGLNNNVSALAVDGSGNLYAGGGFTTAGGMAASGIAKWNGTTWSALGTGLAGVRAIAVDGNTVYAGGSFTQAGGVAASNVAKWNGTTWSALGTGVSGGTYNSIAALAVDNNGTLYAGGSFNTAGGLAVNNIAQWNGTAWSPLGVGMNQFRYDIVYAIVVASTGYVYAGGNFSMAGGITNTSNLAQWNGVAWSALGSGLNTNMGDGVRTLASDGHGGLFAGGRFITVGDRSKVTARFGHYNPTGVFTATAPIRQRAEVSLYPNPAHATATVVLPATLRQQSVRALLLDAQGRVLQRYSLPASATTHTLDVSRVAAGVYTLQFETDRGDVVSQKLAVE